MPATEAADHHQIGPGRRRPKPLALCSASTQKHIITDASQACARRKRWRRSVVNSASVNPRRDAISDLSRAISWYPGRLTEIGGPRRSKDAQKNAQLQVSSLTKN